MIKSRLHILMHDHKVRSISRLSAETGISRPALYRIYNETGDKVEYKTLNTLCKYFNCPIEAILEYVAD